MADSFRQYIITRFNIPIPTMLTRQLDEIDVTTNENYLDSRFELFEKYTVPSVLNQTNQDFKWLILFSDKTPEKYKDKMQVISAGAGNCIPIYMNIAENMGDIIDDILHHAEAAYYLTTRLDNDDALALNFVSETQKIFKEKGPEEGVIIFENGVQYEEKRNLSTFYHFKTNHFGTLVSRKEDRIKTILDFDHMHAAKMLSVRSINNAEPMWMEVIHESNVTNRMHFKYKDIVQNIDLNHYFASQIEAEGGMYSALQLRIMALLNKPGNAFRLYKQYGLKKIIKKLQGRK